MELKECGGWTNNSGEGHWPSGSDLGHWPSGTDLSEGYREGGFESETTTHYPLKINCFC